MTAPTIGERVRWRHDNRWRHGHLTATDTSGALVVRDDHNGAIHTLPAGGVEHEARGPRGGVRWQSVTPVATTTPRRKKARRRASAGQLALFEVGP
jgi:hypothetical protein